jgi:hypothetical protein
VVGRIRFIALVAGVAAFAALIAPAMSSAASTYSWNLASDFTSTGTGANPDHDQYGGTPWSYVEGPVSALAFGHDPSKFTPLSSFATGVRGGLAGWSDPTDQTAFIGINPTDSAITDPSQSAISYPAHTIAIQPPGDRLVAVGWTSPYQEPVTVLVTGTVAENDSSPTCLLLGPGWSLDQDGNQLLAGSTVNGSIVGTPTVNPGDSLYLTLTPGANGACSNANLSLTIQAAGAAPAVTLASPAPNAVIGGGQPTFAGAAGTDFGVSPQVTVRVYTGTAATGTPLETLTTTAAAGAYSVAPTAPLADGTYTAQAEQDDTLTPPDVGHSSAVTFSVQNGGPKVTLDSLGSKPLHTATPTLTGTAGTASGDAKTVAIGVYAGAGENGAPVRFTGAKVGSNGKFSIKITPALADGEYTALAAQSGGPGGGVGISRPMMFEIKANGPAGLALTQPAAGASVNTSSPVFAGTAGTSAGDSKTITVSVYKGGAVRGKPIGKARTTESGGNWSVTWPHQLALGLYTARASQTDNAGHTTRSRAHRFIVVPGAKVIGSRVKVSRSGAVSLPISCLQPAGTVCTDSVLVITQRKFAPTGGGPRGQLQVLFSVVTIPAGQTAVVHGNIGARIARLLRRAAPVKVEVTVQLTASGKPSTKVTGSSVLRVR